MGYRRALTIHTAKKIFNKEAPTSIDSAITSDPGNAYVKSVEKMLSCKLNPKFLSRAPIATKQQVNAIAGLSSFLIQLKPSKNIWN